MILVSRDQELGQKRRVPIGASDGVISQHPSIREVGDLLLGLPMADAYRKADI